jgi:threonine dehydrogenase-like Zn-dependent dehydrogenase
MRHHRINGCSGASSIRLQPYYCGRRNQYKLELARKLGATNLVNTTQQELAATVRSITGGSGTDTGFECIGLAASAKDCLMCLKDGGCLSILGLMEKEADFNLQYIVTHELTIKVPSFLPPKSSITVSRCWRKKRWT